MSIFTKRIMIADDNRVSLRVIQAELEHANFSNIITASDGNEILTSITYYSPDLIILDMVMPPGPGGIAVCKQLRANGYQLPIIITGDNSRPNLNYSFVAGASDYISKPVDRDELIHRVTVHLKYGCK